MLTSCGIHKPESKELKPIPSEATVATFAGGCFWCIEAAFENEHGVYAAISGYSGGDKKNASYRLVSSGTTSHKEAVQVFYDPHKVSYEQLLEIFWRQIDPTDDGGQFADRGDHYRTAIFYHDDVQKKSAEKSKNELELLEKYEKPIVTEILPFESFFEAAEEHQNFAQKRTLYYQRYKKGSGRSDYIEDTWGK